MMWCFLLAAWWIAPTAALSTPLPAHEKSILAELEQLDKALTQAEAALKKDEARYAALQAKIAAGQAALATARVQQDSRWQRYKQRVRSLARQPRAPRWLLLGGAPSLAAYLQSSRLLRQVAIHDKTLHARLAGHTAQLVALQAERQKQEQALDETARKSRQRRDELAKTRGARAVLWQRMRQQQVAQQVAKERRAARVQLQRVVSSLKPNPKLADIPEPISGQKKAAAKSFAPVFGKARGSLPWPAVGPLKVAFGQRIELAFGTVTAHNGWDIAAPAGTPVQAVAPGQVVYAGWLRGYGQMVIVDHGDGYHCVTAHLSSVLVEVNDVVQTGQLLGTVGDTGSLRGTVLYFEIRHKGIPVDPRQWLRR